MVFNVVIGLKVITDEKKRNKCQRTTEACEGVDEEGSSIRVSSI